MTRPQFLSLVALVILGASLASFLNANRPLGRSVAGSAAAAEILARRGSPETVEGKGDLTVVVFTDYDCSACRMASPVFRRSVARDGNIRVVYKDWPIFGERSERAAAVALASDQQGIYTQVHHRLMMLSDIDDAALRAAVEAAGGEWAKLESHFLTHGSEIEKQVLANRMDALSLGLQGTPAYLIGSTLVEGALTEREFLRAIDQARARPM